MFVVSSKPSWPPHKARRVLYTYTVWWIKCPATDRMKKKSIQTSRSKSSAHPPPHARTTVTQQSTTRVTIGQREFLYLFLSIFLKEKLNKFQAIFFSLFLYNGEKHRLGTTKLRRAKGNPSRRFTPPKGLFEHGALYIYPSLSVCVCVCVCVFCCCCCWWCDEGGIELKNRSMRAGSPGYVCVCWIYYREKVACRAVSATWLRVGRAGFARGIQHGCRRVAMRSRTPSRVFRAFCRRSRGIFFYGYIYIIDCKT